MKIAFFGTSDRSTPILDTLNASFDLVLCITKRDEKVGRKQELKETQVKSWAKANEVDYFEINSMKEDVAQIVEEIRSKGIELGVMADFGFIIPKALIDVFPKGIINIHFSKLPQHRGASPVQFALLNGDDKTSITYYLMDESMDTGDILSQYEYKIGKDDTSESLYRFLFQKAGENVAEVVSKYVSGELYPLPQDDTLATYTYSRTNPKRTLVYKEDARIDWNEPHEKIERLIRAYYPWPIAWTDLQELIKGLGLNIKNVSQGKLLVKIYKAKLQNGKLEIERIQAEGKQIISWEEFKNGYLAVS
ncbi:MAG: methionyl-tRNA formyltransferase [Patescibacteria group bacterium]|jgi:methionyl-tRNA formyltransferase